MWYDMERERLTAIKMNIKQIVTGRFIKQEGFTPSYILTKLGLRLSRTRILGTVVDKFISESGKLASITLDDGSDTIRAKVFNDVTMFDNLSIGDTVDVIGRLREYQNEIYIMPEVIAKIGKPLNKNCNANFYLFSYVALHLNELDIDQLIYEYGNDHQPAWIHVSASKNKNKRQILKISNTGTKILQLQDALFLGV